MATVRQYGYYIKGNKVSIVEKDTAFDNDVNSKDYGPGADRAQWKSPLASIDDGLEIEYVYSPEYILSGGVPNEGIGRAPLSGWYIDGDNYLTFITYSESVVLDPLNALSSPYDVSNDEYFYISNSEKWNGLHKAQTVSSLGTIQTYTKVNKSYDTGRLSAVSTNIQIVQPGSTGDAGAYLTGDNNSEIWMTRIFSVGDFVFFTGVATGDGGVYEITDVTTVNNGGEELQKAYLGKKYFLNSEKGIDEFSSSDDHFEGDVDLTARKIKFDPCWIYSDVDALDNEEDIIDLPSYLNKALVYYMKAKVAEDVMNIEAKEYFMLEFRKMVEKYNNIKVAGARMQAPGPFAIK